MIISHKHKFIFVKTRKTAGTSVEISLSRYCGPDDVITPIPPKDEDIRQQHGGLGPQNCEGWVYPLKDLLLEPYRFRKNWNRLKKRRRFYNHIAAARIRERVGRAVWDSYFKFSIERDPWDKTVSNYYWKQRQLGEDFSFDDYMKTRMHPRNHKIYCIGGKLAMDDMIMYESLEDDLMRICKKIGIPFDGWLPNAKGGIRPDRGQYRDFFNETQKNAVARLFKKEIELFGYSFAGRKSA